ncbi:hypothetical protein [Maribacter sp. 2307ULW6-5]|uniref:hypothetical protein n=1 Tax=Maribacter sp. 2307ULW6-5 TaxID=3386275 RepID=UPI0039BD11BB
MKTTLSLVLILTAMMAQAQENLNDYKYIIIPKKFEAFKSVNEHKTSTLLKFLFAEKGFLAVYDDERPEDLMSDPCLGLSANIEDNSGMFTTKTAIALKDCHGKTVLTTKEGRSREKEYALSYGEALRDAMSTFDAMDHTYTEKDVPAKPVTLNFRNDVKEVKDKTPNLKKAKNVDANVTQKATEDQQLYESREPVVSESIKMAPANKVNDLKIKKPRPEDIWYAQSLPNGYQLVDRTPSVKMRLQKSSIKEVYMAQSGEKQGLVHKKGDTWIFEYYDQGTLVQEALKVKF